MTIKVEPVLEIARQIGDTILLPNWGKVEWELKADGSRVTKADKLASEYAITNLLRLTPDIPVISEEATPEQNTEALQSSVRWVVDPLDGTRTYLNEEPGEPTAGFGVHIALVENGVPILGVCHFPAQKRFYYTGNDGRAYMLVGDEAPQQIRVKRGFQGYTIRCAVSWSRTKNPETVNGYLYNAVEAVGGEQICMVACGEADLIWHERADKGGPLKERYVFSHWDVAAAHAVLKAAGGDLYAIHSGMPITYDDPLFAINPCVGGHVDILESIDFRPSGTVPDGPVLEMS